MRRRGWYAVLLRSLFFLLCVTLVAAFDVNPVADKCVDTGIVTCTKPRWAPNSNPLDECFYWDGQADLTCQKGWGPCMFWCQLSGYGPCMSFTITSKSPSMYVTGAGCSSCDQMSQVQCASAKAPASRVAAHSAASSLPAANSALSANCWKPSRAIAKCSNIVWTSNKLPIDRCLTPTGSAILCGTLVAVSLCYLLGYGALVDSSMAVTQSTQYLDGVYTCSTGNCYYFANLTCYTLQRTVTQSVSASLPSSATKSQSPTGSQNVSRSLSPSPSLSFSFNDTLSGSRSRPTWSLTSKLSNTRTSSPTVDSSLSFSKSHYVAHPISTATFVGIALGIDPDTATQVMAAGSTGVAIAGAVSASAGSKQSSLAQLVAISSCQELSEAAESFPVPSTGSVLPAIPGFYAGGDDDVTGASDAAALLASNLVVVILIFVANVTYGAAPAKRTHVETFLTSLHSISISFLGPTLVSTGVTLLRYPFAVEPVLARVVGGFTTVITLAILGATYYACRLPVSQLKGLGAPDVRPSFPQRLEYHWAVFYVSARDRETWYVRQHIFEDLGAAYVLAILGGTYPSTMPGCTTVGGLMLVVAFMHLVYLAAIHPYHERLDMILSFCNGLIVFAVAILTEIALLQPGGSTDFDSPVTTALAGAVLLANCFFFVQTFILAVNGLYVFIMERRKPLPKKDLRRRGHDEEATMDVVVDPISLDALGIEETLMIPLAPNQSPLAEKHLGLRAAPRLLPPSAPVVNPLTAKA